MTAEISIPAAFAAGLLSFLSPCVFPLIPSFLAFIGGTALSPEEGRRRALFRTVFFTLGFSTVFIVISLVFSGLMIMSGFTKYLDIAAGIIIIVLGLHVMFDIFKFLNYEKRSEMTKQPASMAGAFLTGAAFGAGWTPCVGPILGSILLLAGQSGKMGSAALYLAVYSAGLGLPFIAAAAFFDRFALASKKIKKAMPVIKKISGVLLVVIGALILAGRFQALNAILQRWQFSYILWAEDKGPAARALAAWLSFVSGF